jgi:hypothetical protein
MPLFCASPFDEMRVFNRCFCHFQNLISKSTQASNNQTTAFL